VLALAFFIETLNIFDITRLQVLSRFFSLIFVILMAVVTMELRKKYYKILFKFKKMNNGGKKK